MRGGRVTATLAAMAVVLCGCGSGASPDTPRLTTPPTVTAMVITSHANSNCDEHIVGDCWLPLYPTIGVAEGVPLNASTEPHATCQITVDADNAATKAAKEKNCWPQPSSTQQPADTVKLVCSQVVGNELWVGVQLSPEKVLAVKRTVPVTGYARAKFVNAAGIDGLDNCTNK